MDFSKAMSEEKIPKLLFKFALPCVMSLLVGALYSIIDQIFIGNSSLGYLGNAATGISFPVICIANAFAWCIGDASAAYLSICSGQKDTESADKCVGTGLISTFLISILLAVLSLIFQKPLMLAFGASDNTLELSLEYFRIIAAFFPVYLMINVMNSIIRADGSPGYAMLAGVSGAVVNVILDPIFIFALDMGIKGAAIATVISQVLSFTACILYFKKPKNFVLDRHSFKIDFEMIKKLIKLGSSTFITQISIVVMALMSNIMLAHYGELSIYGRDIPISVFSIQTKVYTIVNNIIVGIALGAQPIFGYNYGAKNLDRLKKTYKITLVTALIVAFIATLIFEFFPQIIINIFGKGNELYRDFATKTFRIYLSLCIITGIIKMSSIFFQSIGKAVLATLSSLVRDMLCLVPFTIILCSLFEKAQAGQGIFGVLAAAPLSDIIGGIVVVVLTVSFFHQIKKQ